MFNIPRHKNIPLEVCTTRTYTGKRSGHLHIASNEAPHYSHNSLCLYEVWCVMSAYLYIMRMVTMMARDGDTMRMNAEMVCRGFQ